LFLQVDLAWILFEDDKNDFLQRKKESNEVYAFQIKSAFKFEVIHPIALKKSKACKGE